MLVVVRVGVGERVLPSDGLFVRAEGLAVCVLLWDNVIVAVPLDVWLLRDAVREKVELPASLAVDVLLADAVSVTDFV